MRPVPYLPDLPGDLLVCMAGGYPCGSPDHLDFGPEEEKERGRNSEIAEAVMGGENTGRVYRKRIKNLVAVHSFYPLQAPFPRYVP